MNHEDMDLAYVAVGENCHRCFICWGLVGLVQGGYAGSNGGSGGGQGQGGQARRASQPMDGRTTARPYSRPTDVSQPWETM